VSLTSVVAAAVILAIAAVTVVSRQYAGVQEPTEQERKAEMARKISEKKLVTVEVGGQQVQVDSRTGQIEKLTPEEAQKMAAGLKQLINKSTDDREQVHHADGSVSVDLEDRFQNVTVAREDKDGNLVQSCVDNPKAAGAFFGIEPKQIENKKETPNRPSQLTPATNRN
jgi:hypothetical protein